MNKLTINTSKTVVSWCKGQNQALDISELDLQLCGNKLKVVNEYKYLGVTIDRLLKLDKQAKKVVGLVKTRLAQLRYVRENTDVKTTIQVYTTMIRPIMEYCGFVMDGAPAWVSPKLQVLQNDAIRIAEKIKDPRLMRVHELHALHEMELLQPRRDRQLLSLIYDYAQDEDNLVVPVRALRGNNKKQIKLPRKGKDIYKKSPLYRGVKLWENLSAEQQHLQTKEEFLATLVT